MTLIGGARRLLPVALALTALTCVSPASASRAGGGVRVGPNQTFGGQVNGSTGAEGPVTVRMSCAGPIRPGQTGHPMGGQTLGVFIPEVIAGSFGHTGPQTTSIGAFFNTPPPAAARARGNLTFSRYGVKRLPTTLTLPCAGRGTVYFVPLPTVPGGQDFAVPVTFVGRP